LTAELISSSDTIRQVVSQHRRAGRRVGVVPTMGALHRGHLSLVEACRADCDVVVVTIFVNPTQFGPGEDFERYPRDLESDLRELGEHQVDLVFAPQTEEMYGPDHQTSVQVGRVAAPWEGDYRPGHFDGVATIVLKLFNLVRADIAFFGQKDYQQTLVIRQMVRDLDVPIEIRVCPIVRESDGLALSSRNAYLSSDERARALAISQSLRQAEQMIAGGERQAETVRREMLAHLRSAGVEVQYVTILADGTVDEVEIIAAPVVIAVAGKVGQTRLIDNTRAVPRPD